MTPDHVENRLGQLRADWPVGSVVEKVMSRISTEPALIKARRARSRRLVSPLAALAASGLLAAAGLAWVIITSHPSTLQAAVQDNLARAASAHLQFTFRDDKGQAHKSEAWYRRGEGIRLESPDEVLVEDGQFQWSWRPNAPAGEQVVLRQPHQGFFKKQLTPLLALPDIPAFLSRDRAPEFDRDVNGRACRGYLLTQTGPDPSLPPGARPVDPRPFRVLVLADADERVHEVIMQYRAADGNWQPGREIRIEYNVPVPPERIAVHLPAGARVINRDEVFNSRYPLDQALLRVEIGGLLFAVHETRPLKNREGIYVVSSVRGTPEFLRIIPPRRRMLNPEVSLLDVAFQPMGNGMMGGKYDRLSLGNASREGVEYAWWLVIPRKYFRIKDGKRVYEPESDTSWVAGEPGRLDGLPGRLHVPLSATYWDESHRDARGVQQSVSQWVEVPLPPDRSPTTIDDVASRARHDLLLMRHGGSYALLGIAADTKPDASTLRSMTHFEPDQITDAEYAAAVRRGIDDLRELDKVWDPMQADAPLK
jgi:outer membrane lipoprotein-sorting protein